MNDDYDELYVESEAFFAREGNTEYPYARILNPQRNHSAQAPDPLMVGMFNALIIEAVIGLGVLVWLAIKSL